MHRLWIVLSIAGFMGCSGRKAPSTPSPTLSGSPLTGNHPAPPPSLSSLDSLGLALGPTLDSLLVDDVDDRREAADSAADEAVLEELAEAHPDETPEEGTDEAIESDPGGANAVTWDIDVATYNSHDRVQYYLDFFQSRGRERMEVWLTRLPRYEGMIRERLQRERLPGD